MTRNGRGARNAVVSMCVQGTIYMMQVLRAGAVNLGISEVHIHFEVNDSRGSYVRGQVETV